MIYANLPKTIDEQMELLRGRGLVMTDAGRAREMLGNISYFRLASYLRYFEQETENHAYRPGTTLDEVVRQYEFDRELRLLVFSAIQDIEIALRTRMIQHFSMLRGSFWFMDGANFDDAAIHERCLRNLRRELARSNEDFIAEHSRRYDSPECPPAWKTLEVSSFGTLSNLYCNFVDNEAKKLVARSLGLPHPKFLESWIQAATVLRNACAHHARIWNRRFAVKPKMPASLPSAWISPYHGQPIKLYPQLCCLAYLDRAIWPNGRFVENLKALINAQDNLDFHAMGFPEGWQDEPLWKI